MPINNADGPTLACTEFPDAAADPIVDVLIGQDQIDLHS